jgi:hypothetical protein
MKAITMVAGLCSSILVAGCNTVPASSVETKPTLPDKKIRISVEPDKFVRITNASVSQTSGGVRVSGVLRPKSAMVRSIGHLHVSFLDSEGIATQLLKVEPTSNVFFRRSIIKPKFNVTTAVTPERVSEVRLKHHKTAIDVCDFGHSNPPSTGGVL